MIMNIKRTSAKVNFLFALYEAMRYNFLPALFMCNHYFVSILILISLV